MSGAGSDELAADVLARLLAEHPGLGAALALHAGGRTRTVVAGTANMRAGWPVTPDTVFQLGSVSKIYTAVALLQLVAPGLVDLDAAVARWVPEWQGALADERCAAITPRHLLCHTSGLQSQHFEPYGRGDGALGRLAAALATDTLVHPPGRLFSYSNTGYSVAGRLLQVVTGLSWDDCIARFVCAPLSLRSTVTLPEDVLLHPAAAGSRRDPDGRPAPVGTWYGSRALTPSGGVSATAAELVTVALAATGGDGAGALDLGAELTAEMLAPQVGVLRAGTQAWGLGWTLFATDDGTPLVGHNGDTPGQAAFLRVAPDRAVALALLVNRQLGRADVEPLLEPLLEDVAGVRPQREAPVAQVAGIDAAPLLGTFAQDRYEVVVEPSADQPGRLTLATRQWGRSTLDWFGRSEIRRALPARVEGPDSIVADGQRWWFLEPGEGGRYAYVTNGHLAFPRR